MSTDARYKGPADPTTPCDACGGPTYTFPSGSIWCPNNECQSGAHFVKRVAFERAPGKVSVSARRLGGARAETASLTPRVKPIKSQPIKSQPSFAGGYDDFVDSENIS